MINFERNEEKWLGGHLPIPLVAALCLRRGGSVRFGWASRSRKKPGTAAAAMATSGPFEWLLSSSQLRPKIVLVLLHFFGSLFFLGFLLIFLVPPVPPLGSHGEDVFVAFFVTENYLEPLVLVSVC